MVVDLFPWVRAPSRLDLFGGHDRHHSTYRRRQPRLAVSVKEVRLLPGREFRDDLARSAFRSRWREVFEGDPSRATMYRDIGNGIPAAGIEYYLPLFFEQTATLFDYLPEGTCFALMGDIDAAIQRFWNDTKSRYQFKIRSRAALAASRTNFSR